MKSEMQSNRSSQGIDLLLILAVIFVTFKLAGIIEWSWLAVLTPIWFPIGIMLLTLTGTCIITAIIKLMR